MTNHQTVTSLPSLDPFPPPPGTSPAHHIGTPVSSFQNPWPSFQKKGLLDFFRCRFSFNRNFVPVPTTREELVHIREPTWGDEEDPDGRGLRATWIGHASWLIETPRQANGARGIRILCDPVFAERTSPFQWFGPARYTPTPCTIQDLPEVDAILISHNHYDHLCHGTLQKLFEKQAKNKPHVFCPLANKTWFINAGFGLSQQDVTELDWWEGSLFNVPNIGLVELFATPCQHVSSRTGIDGNKALWSSWVIREAKHQDAAEKESAPFSLFFAGDTGYRDINTDDPSPEEEAAAPRCPAFAQIGSVFGSFDLALLPIGLMMPRSVMSSVHCSPEDSVCVHRDINAKRSLGMHYGTVRGGISAQYEDVRVPPRRWEAACKKEGFKWRSESQNDNDWQAGLCDIGETVIIR